MTTAMATKPVATVFQDPRSHPNESDKRKKRDPLTDAQVRAWQKAARKVREIATQSGRSKADIARRAGINNARLNTWYDGEYAGDFHAVTEEVERWLKSVEAMDKLRATIPSEPPFVQTKTAREIEMTLLYAQMQRELVIVTTGSGVGKTATCKRFRDASPHVHLVTMRPNTKRNFGMLQEIGRVIGVRRTNSADFDHAIGERLEQGGGDALLIIDEAQELNDEAVNQLRFFPDNFRCGVALVGNDEIYTRFHQKGGPSYAQIKGRIGKRLKRMEPRPEDIVQILDGWRVTDPEQRELLKAIGEGEGALRNMAKTYVVAQGYALGADREVNANDIRVAYQARSVGE
ncbi:MAG: AAA family ATPase [Pseudomonadota bacterium]